MIGGLIDDVDNDDDADGGGGSWTWSAVEGPLRPKVRATMLAEIMATLFGAGAGSVAEKAQPTGLPTDNGSPAHLRE